MSCLTCGQDHGLCHLCHVRTVHCPEDEPGLPFSFCDLCDAELAGEDHEPDEEEEAA